MDLDTHEIVIIVSWTVGAFIFGAMFNEVTMAEHRARKIERQSVCSYIAGKEGRTYPTGSDRCIISLGEQP